MYKIFFNIKNEHENAEPFIQKIVQLPQKSLRSFPECHRLHQQGKPQSLLHHRQGRKEFRQLDLRGKNF